MSTTVLLATLRAAQHLVTRLSDAGFPPTSASADRYSGIGVHLTAGRSARIAAATLALDVTESTDHAGSPECPPYTMVRAKVGTATVTIFGVYHPASTTADAEALVGGAA